MKLNILTTAAILALIGAATTQSAKAQFATSGAAPGDLILGFDNGSGTDYEIDLGQYSLYQGNSEIDITNIAAGLASYDGASWYSDSNLQLAFGGQVGTTVLISAPTSAGFAPIINSSLGGIASDLATLGGVIGATPTPTAGPTTGSLLVSTSNSASSSAALGAAGLGFGTSSASFNGSTDPLLFLDVLTGKGASFSVKGTGTSVTGANPFSITSDGEVVYDAQTNVVPEPSTYALGVAGLLLLVALKRRQQNTAKL